MQSIRLAAAQSTSCPGDIAANVRTHIKFIDAAHQANIDLLVFPELSLSGYELPRLRDCIVDPTDSVLAGIRERVLATKMTVIVGAPVSLGTSMNPAIGAITFFADGSHSIYCKQHLHPGEEKFATQVNALSRKDVLHDEAYSLAICADTAFESHAVSAAKTGASLYLAGVLVSEAGYAPDTTKMQNYASTLNIGVLMSNHGGPSGGYISAGKSAFWAPGGKLVAQAPGTGNVLVVAAKSSDNWDGAAIPV